MRRHLSLLIAFPLVASVYVAGCLSDSDSDGVSGAGGAAGSSNNKGSGGSGATSGAGGSATMGGGGSTAAGSGGAGGDPGPDPSQNEANKDADPKYVSYRDDLTQHPGCTKDGLETRPGQGNPPDPNGGYKSADIPGFPCAAKAYDATSVDPAKPIVILVHGNSSTPLDYEAFLYEGVAGPPLPQLSERLVAAGFRVYSADFRYDRVPDDVNLNPAKNFDHGWAVPILQGMVRALMQQYPEQKVSMVGFSLGTTIIRDTLRRMHRAKEAPFARVKDLVLIAGGNHGVSTFVGPTPNTNLCGDVDNPVNPTLRGAAACQLGDRGSYVPVPFQIPLNGPEGAFETPCIDGVNAFGQAGVCGNNAVQYTTIVKEDPENGPLQDEFVSEGSAALKGANNLTVADKDPTRYFFGFPPMAGQTEFAAFDDHYGALRSEAALTLIMAALND
jgi:pimeloyl-ACP methyl ester carboxylesterase